MNDDPSPDGQGSVDAAAMALEVRRMAHDLNNALMPLMMGVTLLRRKVADPSLERTLANMETSVRRAADLASALLALGRTHSAQQPTREQNS